MPVDLYTTLHLLLLCGFLGTTSALLILSVINRLRVRRVLLAWHPGRLLGLPTGPALFTGAVAGLLAYAGYTGLEMQTVMLSGYLAGSLFWCVASWLSGSVLVSAYGLVGVGHRGRQSVAWSRVVDYACSEQEGRVRYLFFYLDEEGARPRFDLDVPPARREAFQEIVEAKVDDRFDFSMRRIYGSEALEE